MLAKETAGIRQHGGRRCRKGFKSSAPAGVQGFSQFNIPGSGGAAKPLRPTRHWHAGPEKRWSS